MGLGNNGSKVLYSLKLPSRANVATIAVHLRQSEITSADPANHSASDRPVIYVDANNVINVVSRKAVDPVAHTANFLKEWSQEGFIVVPVCDGPRPQSKQQTNKSRAVRQKAKHKSVILRQDLRRIFQLCRHIQGNKVLAIHKNIFDKLMACNFGLIWCSNILEVRPAMCSSLLKVQ
mmetsp:Transcript_23886/g.47402  ORF Transcript_23886/g.47402 Transcript_23886/m.47402 type:complete len:177 (+) Transcript_23886:91-621(+)